MLEAGRRARHFRRQFHQGELAIIYGGVAAAAFGLGASLSEHPVFGFTEVVLTAALGSLAFVARGLKWQRRWLRHRLLAEMLRGERFLFIGRLGPYAGGGAAERILERRVIAIERAVREETTKEAGGTP
ncbi:MAG: DUF4231 domain-containing protein [Gemmatimonadales bacterium]